MKKHRAHFAVVDEDVFATTFLMSVRDCWSGSKMWAQKSCTPKVQKPFCVLLFLSTVQSSGECHKAKNARKRKFCQSFVGTLSVENQQEKRR